MAWRGVAWRGVVERGVVERGVVCVRGSYSARVPRSSLAEVHTEFVHHIVEDEVDGQEERQDDRREDGEEGEESGVVEERTIRHNARVKREMERVRTQT